MLPALNFCPKRFLRLRTFFHPYSFVRLRLKLHVIEPVVVQASAKKTSRSYCIDIYPNLLDSTCPDWVETAIFSYSLLFIKTRTCNQKSAKDIAQATNWYTKLKKLFEALRTILPTKPDIIARPESGSLPDLWKKLQEAYFPENYQLLDYRVGWSNRSNRNCLASCNYINRKVSVAKALASTKYCDILPPLLYHEMCHAVLGKPEIVGGRRVIHGVEFKQLEARHPGISYLNHWIKTGGWRKAVKEFDISMMF